MKKIIMRAIGLLLVLALGYGIYYAWIALPIITAYSAKNTCSCVLLGGRDVESVKREELGGSPLNLATVNVNLNDSSATSSVFGLAERKAIYRKGLGCTILSEMDEAALRTQKILLPVRPAVNPDTILWPAGNKITDSLPRFDQKKLNAVLDEAFSEPSEKKLRRTRAMIIVYNDKIIAERYAEGHSPDSKLTGWSMSKSITNALVGVLVRKGKLTLNAPATVDSWRNDERKDITLNHLMQACSGLEWSEVYGGPSGATNMLFKKKDAGLYAASFQLQNKPGTDFYYSSGTTNIISRIVRNTVGDSSYYRFPYEEVLYKIGMYNTVLEPDAGGTFVGSSFTFGTARDWARFGLLYLHDGIWNGERILPEGWVKYTTTPAAAAERGEYGAQFWLNAGEKGNPANRIFPSAPPDLFWADGYEGQNVFIIPSKNLVIVKLSLSSGDYLDDDKFLKDVIETLEL